MGRRRVNDYNEVRSETLPLFHNKPVTEAIAKVFSYRDIHERLERLPAEDDRDWSNLATVESVVRRARDDHWKELHPTRRPKKMPRAKEWMAEDLAVVLEVVYLRLSTSKTVSAPLEGLLRSTGTGSSNWEEPTAAAALEVFQLALVATDEVTGLRMVDLLPFRSSMDSGRAVKVMIGRDPSLAIQLGEYWKLWEKLLDHFDLQMVSGLRVPEFLRSLAALQDGFLSLAAGTGTAREELFARRFATSVVAILKGSVTEAGR